MGAATAPGPATGVIISGMGLTDDTTGGCARITRGNVTLDGIICRGATRTAAWTAAHRDILVDRAVHLASVHEGAFLDFCRGVRQALR